MEDYRARQDAQLAKQTAMQIAYSEARRAERERLNKPQITAAWIDEEWSVPPAAEPEDDWSAL